MKLNDFLTVSPTIFDDGWEAAPVPPMPSFLKYKVGPLTGFANRSKQVTVNISLEEAGNPLPYLHLSIRHMGGNRVTDEEALNFLNLFFPGAVIAKKPEDVDAGMWVERRGVGIMSAVRHFSKFIKEKT